MAKPAKFVAETNEHTMDVDSDPFLSDVEEGEVLGGVPTTSIRRARLILSPKETRASS